MKKSLVFILSFILLVSFISGCTGNQGTTKDTGSSDTTSISTSESQGKEVETTEPETVLPFKETLKITQAELWRPENDTEVYTYQVLQERLNMEIEYIQIPVANAAEQYAMILASGDLPDVVNFSSAVPIDWIKFGAVKPLDDLINKHAPDFVSKLSDEDYIHLRSADGNIYTIPRHNGDVAKVVGASSLCIRQDWLDNLNLEMPITLDEWEAVFTAFKNNDPNGNGKNDEIPWGGTFAPVWDAYGLSQLYVINEDNTLTLKYKDKYFIEAVKKLADWYAKGLIDQEYITRNKNYTEKEAIVYNGICGAMDLTGNHATEATRALRLAGIEDALFVSSKLMEGPRGRNVAGRSSIQAGGCAITSQAIEPEKIMQYFNYAFTEEGIELFNHGVEGVTFDIVNGRKVLKQELVDGGWNEVRRYGINKSGGTCYYWLADMFLQITFGGKTIDTMDEVSSLAYKAYTDEEVAKYRYQFLPPSLNQVQAYVDYDGASLLTELNDMVDQVIMGLKPASELEKLIDEIYEAGFKQIEKEANELWQVLSK